MQIAVTETVPGRRPRQRLQPAVDALGYGLQENQVLAVATIDFCHRRANHLQRLIEQMALVDLKPIGRAPAKHRPPCGERPPAVHRREPAAG